MKDRQDYLYAKDVEKLQIPYGEYASLMEEMEKASNISQVRERVAADLQRVLNGNASVAPETQQEDLTVEETQAPIEQHVHAEPDTPAESDHPAEPEMPAESKAQEDEIPRPEVEEATTPSEVEESPEQQPNANVRAEMGEVPPIKQEIAEHFNTCDESGRIFNIFKQYYTCLNESCGGTVRVTMKDGFCSLWNYDEWEEFAWVDIYEDLLRIAIAPRYTDALKSLSLCEAPRLISTRRNVICVQVGDLNNTVLEVLAKAFSEVGMQVG
jgi:hypothetical protein